MPSSATLPRDAFTFVRSTRYAAVRCRLLGLADGGPPATDRYFLMRGK
jgi:hypothetical protein